MITGTYRTTVDDDGEIRLPDRWESEKGIWLGVHLGILAEERLGWIGLYEEGAFGRLAESVAACAGEGPAGAQPEWLLYASAYGIAEEFGSSDMGGDEYSYIILPEELKAYLEMTDVALIGCGDHFEITAWPTWMEELEASAEVLRSTYVGNDRRKAAHENAGRSS